MKNKKQNNLFLVIGTPKSGTTWVYSSLNSLNHFYMPPAKEIRFWGHTKRPFILYGLKKSPNLKYFLTIWLNDTFSNIKKTPKNIIWYLCFFLFPKNIIWYKYLLHISFISLSVDITPTYYICSKKEIEKIFFHFPNVKVLIILRDPIERAWSHAKMHFSSYGNSSITNISEKEIIEFLLSPKLLNYADYATHLKNWKSIIPAEQFKISYYIDLKNSAEKFLDSVLNFLNKEDISTDTINFSKYVNKGSEVSIPENIIKAILPTYLNYINSSHDLLKNKYSTNWVNKYKRYF